MRTFTRRGSFYSTLVLTLLATFSLSACAPHALDEKPVSRAEAVETSDVNREAGAYRDSRLCVKNSTSENFDLGPGYETQGTFGTVTVGQTKCFDSNNTTNATANIILFYSNGSQILMNLENYATTRPDFRVIDPVTSRSHVEGTMNQKDSVGPFTLADHTFSVTRNKDADYWVVYTADVKS